MQSGRRKFIMGIFFTLLGGALWGISGTSVQYLTTIGGTTPAFLTSIRSVFSAIVFLTYFLIRRREDLMRLLHDGKSLVNLVIFSVALFCNQLFYAYTVQITNAGTATVLQMLGSVFVMLYYCLIRRKLPYLNEFVGLVLAIIATVLIATQGNPGVIEMPEAGLFWGILLGITTAIYIVMPKQSGLFEKYGSLNVVGWAMIVCAFFAYPAYLMQGGSFDIVVSTLVGFSAFDWILLIGGLTIFGTIAGYGLYLYGVSIVGAVKGSLLGAIEPVSASVIAALWLGTVFSIYDLLGLILMCLMVGLIATGSKNQ